MGEFLCYRPYYCCLWIYDLFMDYDRFFRTSVCAFSDAVQDRWNSHVCPTHNITAAAMPAAVTPAAHAASGKFWHCQCGRRMSSLSYDPFVCSLYGGFECMTFVSRSIDCFLMCNLLCISTSNSLIVNSF